MYKAKCVKDCFYSAVGETIVVTKVAGGCMFKCDKCNERHIISEKHFDAYYEFIKEDADVQNDTIPV